MKIESVIVFVNSMCKDSRYSSARDMIIKEWPRLTDRKNYVMLNNSAQDFMKIIKEEKEKGTFNELSFHEKKVLNIFNQYVREVNIKEAKRIFIDNQLLFSKPSAQNWLSSDAKIYYEAWKKANNLN